MLALLSALTLAPTTYGGTVATASPTDGATVSGTVSWAASYSTKPRRVDFYIDGVRKWRDWTAPFSRNWNTVKYANGAHRLKVRAVWRSRDRDSSAVSVTVTNVVGDASPTPDPSPSPDLAQSSTTALAWSPPALTNPVTINVPSTNGYVVMDKTRDYIVNVGDLHDDLWLQGGHNVVLLGGKVTPPYGGSTDQYYYSSVKVRDATGTVHIEGLWVDGVNGYVSDCIVIDAPQAILQLENIRCDDAGPSVAGEHPDAFQTQGGFREIRIDHFTGSTHLQGIFLSNHGHLKVGSVDLRNVNMHALSGAHHGCLAKWEYDFSASIENFWCALGGSSYPWFDQFYPQLTSNLLSYTPSDCYGVLPADASSYTWTPSCRIAGAAQNGVPSGGDFVPAGVAGLTYLAPGYAP
jgi:hypothetical protein